MIKKFEKFLKENDLLDKFQKNYESSQKTLSKNYPPGAHLPVNALDFAKTTDPRLYLSHCFLWKRAPESKQFWSEQNQKWWRKLGIIK